MYLDFHESIILDNTLANDGYVDGSCPSGHPQKKSQRKSPVSFHLQDFSFDVDVVVSILGLLAL